MPAKCFWICRECFSIPVRMVMFWFRCGKIWISAEEEENDILFYVEDNGCGICEEDLKEILDKERKSIGVRNTNKRIYMIYGEKYGVTISSQLEEGTVVTIRLPLKINSKKQS